MTNPIDVIAQAIRTADGGHALGAGALAEVAANTLTDERLIPIAVEALKQDGWTETPEGPFGLYRFSDDELADIARTVLGSVEDGA